MEVMVLCMTHAIVLVVCTLWWTGASGHIGEPCNSILKMCLPPSPHIYCDEKNICRCKSDFPVEIQPHTCKAAKRIGQRCSHPRECTHSDPNSFCTKTPYSSECSCAPGFTFNYSEDRCVAGGSQKHGPSSRSDSKWFLPSTIGFSLLCLALAFCFSFFWYFFCRQPPDTWEAQMRQREARAQIVRLNDRSNRTPADYLNVRTSSASSHLPTYESAVYNEPPPTYEDAIQIKSQTQPFTCSPSSSCPADPVVATTRRRRIILPNHQPD